MNGFDDAHVVERHMQIVVRQRLQLAATKPGATERRKVVAIRPLDGLEDIWTVARAADGNEEIAGAGEILQLFDEDAIESFIVSPGQNIGRVIGQAENAETLLGVVVEIFSTDRSLAHVLAKVRGVGTAASVAA